MATALCGNLVFYMHGSRTSFNQRFHSATNMKCGCTKPGIGIN